MVRDHWSKLLSRVSISFDLCATLDTRPHWTKKKYMTTQRNLMIVKSTNLHKRSRPKFHLLNGFSSDQVELFAVEEATTLSLEITIRFCWCRVSFNFVVVESSSLRKGSGLCFAQSSLRWFIFHVKLCGIT